MPNHTPKSIQFAEILVILLVFVIVLSGMTLSYLHPPAFVAMIREDGLVEWLTVGGLILAMAVCFMRVATLHGEKPWVFLTVSGLGGLAFLFGAGEEISWGQRIFGFQSPAWFAAQNVQGETNLHNLAIGDWVLTKSLFGRVAGILLGLYFAVLTPLYVFSEAVARRIDIAGIPIPRTRQIVAFAVFTALLHVPDIPGRESELFELAAVFLVLVILVNPRNSDMFRNTAKVPGSAPLDA